jgi:hypothetical protein
LPLAREFVLTAERAFSEHKPEDAFTALNLCREHLKQANNPRGRKAKVVAKVNREAAPVPKRTRPAGPPPTGL